jgi:hypothetical protein
MNEELNYFLSKNSMKIIEWFGYNMITYSIFSFIYGLGQKYSFGCIKLSKKNWNGSEGFFSNGEEILYIEFLPWGFANISQTKDKYIKRKILLYGIRDFMKMTKFLEKNKKNIPAKIFSESNQEIAILINKKLCFEFMDYKNFQEVKSESKKSCYRLFSSADTIIEFKGKTEKIIRKLNN